MKTRHGSRTKNELESLRTSVHFRLFSICPTSVIPREEEEILVSLRPSPEDGKDNNRLKETSGSPELHVIITPLPMSHFFNGPFFFTFIIKPFYPVLTRTPKTHGSYRGRSLPRPPRPLTPVSLGRKLSRFRTHPSRSLGLHRFLFEDGCPLYPWFPLYLKSITYSFPKVNNRCV